MKVDCSKCKKTINAPDEWAGKRIKCPRCKNSIKLPSTSDESLPDDLSFDFGSLLSVESGGEPVIRDEKRKPLTLKEAQELAAAAHTEQEEKISEDPTIRVCPRCGQHVKSLDIYGEVMCRHCGSGIPGKSLSPKHQAKYQQDISKTLTTFYGGFTSAVIYPLPAINFIAIGMAVAFGTIALPLLAMLGLSSATGLNPVTIEEGGGADFGWAGIFITCAFAIQGIYFGSVCYYLVIDTIRTTASGNEQPPKLSWNIMNLGLALVGYAILIVLYFIIAILMVTISEGFPSQSSDFEALGQPINLVILALLTFSVPMSIIGLASSNALDGLNPIRVTKSILATHGNYVFLFLVNLLYFGFYIGIMIAVLSVAGSAILNTAKEGLGAGVLPMLGGLLAWAVVLGLGFYFAYSIGRILGLFTRTYRKNLNFEI